MWRWVGGGGADSKETEGPAGLSLRTPTFFFGSESPKEPPTANRQPPTATNCQLPTATNCQLPTANRHQPPTVFQYRFCVLVSCPCLAHEAESVPMNVRFCWRYKPFSLSLKNSPGDWRRGGVARPARRLAPVSRSADGAQTGPLRPPAAPPQPPPRLRGLLHLRRFRPELPPHVPVPRHATPHPGHARDPPQLPGPAHPHPRGPAKAARGPGRPTDGGGGAGHAVLGLCAAAAHRPRDAR